MKQGLNLSETFHQTGGAQCIKEDGNRRGCTDQSDSEQG